MRRRDLLRAAGASLAALAAPRIGRAERSNKLVFVPTEDLGVLDPVVTGIRSTRNHAYLVFDTLYGIDTNWTAQPQMVEGHQVEEDGLIWTLIFRDGLRFHDKEPETLRSRGVLFCSNPRGNNEEGLSGDRYCCFFDHDTCRDYVTAAGFFQVRHYYRPPGLPRHKQWWLATVWRKR